MDKTLFYKKLIQSRNALLLSPIVALCTILFFVFLGVSEQKASIFGAISSFLWLITWLFIFLSRNCCPWCKNTFYFKNGLPVFTLHFFKNRCVNCGEPDSVKKSR